MRALLLAPVAIQGAVMLVDELVFHRRRGLPRWERIGHPLDTLTVAACLVWLIAMPPSQPALSVYIGLAVFSTLFVTKDEAVHARLCGAGEHWLHAVLFALHPIVLGALGILWWTGHPTVLAVQLAAVLAIGLYQVVYWNVGAARHSALSARAPATVDNALYGTLGEAWYDADDSPIALLRAEARHRSPWVAETLATSLAEPSATVLDLGCGAGYLTNFLADRGHRVTGLDTSAEALAVAHRHDATGSVRYLVGDACALPFPDGRFDAVCAMDLIEHVTEPERLVVEAARVLRPGGLFFFHTFNRTWQAHLIVIKGVEWFVRNTPRDMHVIDLFRSPEEVGAWCRRARLEPICLLGSRPRFDWPLWRMLATGRVGDDFRFRFTRSTKLGYTGYARKLTAA
jgi:2-polyprenyl-6-hydroxyphenyl methylase/3-demethylubiquinone-9 3-methyltransferase